MGVKFNDKVLIDKLNILEKSQIPFAANQALKRFGFLMKSQLLPQEFEKQFDAPDGYGRPVPRTLNAVQYKAEGLTLAIKIKKDSTTGISPGEYLRSALVGGEATDTAIHSAIRGITSMYPVPAYGNLKALGALTQGADVKPSYAGKVITGLERNFVRKQQPVGGERFVASTDGKGLLKRRAVYRVKGSSVTTVFNLFENRTKLEPIFDYRGFVYKAAEERLPSLISLSLQRAMASM